MALARHAGVSEGFGGGAVLAWYQDCSKAPTNLAALRADSFLDQSQESGVASPGLDLLTNIQSVRSRTKGSSWRIIKGREAS